MNKQQVFVFTIKYITFSVYGHVDYEIHVYELLNWKKVEPIGVITSNSKDKDSPSDRVMRYLEDCLPSVKQWFKKTGMDIRIYTPEHRSLGLEINQL